MLTAEKQRDTMFDKNLRSIGTCIELPAESTTEQLARWKAVPNQKPLDGRLKRHAAGPLRMPRYLRLAAGFALASSIGVVAWLSLETATPASAATIFRGFESALGQSVRIVWEDLDLGTVVVSGQLYLGENDAPEAQDDDLLYSELHVKLLADNPRWADFDAVAVTYQAADEAWSFTRGNGIGGGDVADLDGRLVPWIPEMFSRSVPLTDIHDLALAPFGGIPPSMSISVEGDTVRYRFPEVQRDYIASLMQWLLDFASADTGAQLVADLEALARDLRVDTSDPQNWILTANGPFGPTLHDEELTIDVWVYADPATGRVFAWDVRNEISSTGEVSEYLRDCRAEFVRVLGEKHSTPGMVEYLHELAESIEVDESDPDRWVLRATSVHVPTGVEVFAPGWKIPENVQLTIHYDPAAELVRSAEFAKVGSEAGVIRIELSGSAIDPAVLNNPQSWITQRTQVDD